MHISNSERLLESPALTALNTIRHKLAIGETEELDRSDASVATRPFFDAPAIGLDLDGCIDEAPAWFRILSRVWPGPVYVITYRNDAEKARRDVARFGVQCDEVIVVSRFEAKAEVIAEHNLAVYFDDQDEILLHIPEGVTVLKIRNGGNYDFEDRKWLFSNRTGRLI
jgi:hypothetical protein